MEFTVNKRMLMVLLVALTILEFTATDLSAGEEERTLPSISKYKLNGEPASVPAGGAGTEPTLKHGSHAICYMNRQACM